MNDFTVLHGNDLDKLRNLEGFYNQVKELVRVNEQYSDNISLNQIKAIIRKYFPDSN